MSGPIYRLQFQVPEDKEECYRLQSAAQEAGRGAGARVFRTSGRPSDPPQMLIEGWAKEPAVMPEPAWAL